MKNKKEKLEALKKMQHNSEGMKEDNLGLEPTSSTVDNPDIELVNRKLFRSTKNKDEAEDKAKKSQPLSGIKLEELMKIVEKLKK